MMGMMMSSSSKTTYKIPQTDPPAEIVPLDSFPQWQAEVGYWVGEYTSLHYHSFDPPVSTTAFTVYGADGSPNQSANFNYRYDAYRGFITGNVQGLAYRQRNVFLYPPQFAEQCEVNDSVIGEGVCGINGNSKIFEADQVASVGTTDGSISGLFAGLFDTQTTLIGRDNALLYQVFFGDVLFQSQLTTLTQGPDGVQRRTRSAQSFNPGTAEPSNLSFFRERQVTKEEFYNLLEETLMEYNILESDTCAWQDDFTGQFPAVPTAYTPGPLGCQEHLEQSFECFWECDDE
eukprot:scaffold36700_cov176-Amphora_coffeaeformis.AAC.1